MFDTFVDGCEILFVIKLLLSKEKRIQYTSSSITPLISNACTCKSVGHMTRERVTFASVCVRACVRVARLCAIGVKKYRVNPARYRLNGVLIQSGNSNPKRSEGMRAPPSVDRIRRPAPGDIWPAWESPRPLEYSKHRRRPTTTVSRCTGFRLPRAARKYAKRY